MARTPKTAAGNGGAKTTKTAAGGELIDTTTHKAIPLEAWKLIRRELEAMPYVRVAPIYELMGVRVIDD